MAASNYWLMGLELDVVLLTGVAVLLGSVVQGAAGFGVSLVAVPVLTLLDPTLIPGSILVVGTLLPLFTLAREGAYVDWTKASLSLVGRLVGTAGGIWVLAALSSRSLSIGIGVLVLAGAVLSVWNVRVPASNGSLFGAGVMTGVTGTATSVSGPVVGLVLQRLPGPQLRATMAVFFTIGTLMSLTALAVSGHLPGRQVACGVALLPFFGAGHLLSGPLRRHLDNGWMRVTILTLSTCSALVVLAKALFLR